MPEPWGRQLYRYRQKAGVSLRRLGAEIGVSFSTLGRIERGDGEPDAHTRLAVERWIFPDREPAPCGCPRCAPLPHKRLEAMEQRITTLEAQVAALEQHAHTKAGGERKGRGMGFKNNDRCLDKVAENEPIFVLRAQDILAPQIVRYWIALAIEHGNPSQEKIDEAQDLARLMEAWPTRKYPD